MREELGRLVGTDETILYEGKPHKACFLFEAILNPLLPFAILWAVIDFGILGQSLFNADFGNFSVVLIPFMLLHLMPVWIYLGGVLFSFRKYRNTAYVVTDKAIYASSGVFTCNINTKPFAELSHIDLHRGVFDQMFHVGDIIATTSQIGRNGKPATIGINSIADYAEVYNLVKKLQIDIYSDVMYPNAKRPEENPGYRTKYTGL